MIARNAPKHVATVLGLRGHEVSEYAAAVGPTWRRRLERGITGPTVLHAAPCCPRITAAKLTSGPAACAPCRSSNSTGVRRPRPLTSALTDARERLPL